MTIRRSPIIRRACRSPVGLSLERLAAQRDEIERVNARYRGRFRLLAGIEANIREKR